MGLVQFLSFGTWSTLFTEDQLFGVWSMFAGIVIGIIIKTFTMIAVDERNHSGEINFFLHFSVRLLSMSSYIVILSIVTLFNNPELFLVTEAILIALMAIMGIYSEVDTDTRDYILITNRWVGDKTYQFNAYLKKREEIKMSIKLINKSIYDYQKRACIG